MKTALIICNARDIPECLRSFHLLSGIDKIYFRGFTEEELVEPIAEFVDNHDYDYYMLISDDVIVPQNCIDSLLKYIPLASMACIVGWCRVTVGSSETNVSVVPLKHLDFYYSLVWTAVKIFPKWVRRILLNWTKGLGFSSISDVDKIVEQAELFRVYFQGNNFILMSKELWQRFPFDVYNSHLFWIPKAGSDNNLCSRMNAVNFPMLCVKNAEFIHLRSMKNFIVGKVPKQIWIEHEQEPRILYRSIP